MIKFFAFLCVLLHITIEINAQNPCAGVFAGSVPHPDPRRCSEYYVCIFFIGSLQQCKANHIFDGSSGNCISGDPSTCLQNTTPSPPTTTTIGIATTTIGIATTPSTTTIGIITPPATTTTMGIATSTTIGIGTTSIDFTTTTSPPSINPSEICRDVFFAARPHPTSNFLFVGCIRGEGTIMPCNPNEYFDVLLNECTKIPSVCVVPEDICVGQQLEVITHPCYCYRYIVCYSNQNIMDSECSVGNIFDASSKECRPGNWETCEPEPEFTRPTPITTTTAIFENPCEGVILGNRPMDGSCTMYYRCVTGWPTQQECSAGEIFNRESLQCVPGSIDECELKY